MTEELVASMSVEQLHQAQYDPLASDERKLVDDEVRWRRFSPARPPASGYERLLS